MAVYVDLVLLLNFLVDLLLLMGTNRLSGFPPGGLRCVAAAAVGALYAAACLLPGFGFLGSFLWRAVSLGLMGSIAFGWNPSALKRGVLFLLLTMALGGLAVCMDRGGFGSLLLCAGLLALLCRLGFRGRAGGQRFVPVALCYGGRRMRLVGLEDTGNTLTDPVTGQQVLVAGAQVARGLVGLSPEQLRDPVATLAAGVLPGLRLIPYRAVGRESGMLLGIRLPDTRVGAWQGSAIVAFAPEELGGDGTYQILTGGMA